MSKQQQSRKYSTCCLLPNLLQSATVEVLIISAAALRPTDRDIGFRASKLAPGPNTKNLSISIKSIIVLLDTNAPAE